MQPANQHLTCNVDVSQYPWYCQDHEVYITDDPDVVEVEVSDD